MNRWSKNESQRDETIREKLKKKVESNFILNHVRVIVVDFIPTPLDEGDIKGLPYIKP